MPLNESSPDLDAITRNLIALDLDYIDPKEASPVATELSALAGLNEVLEISAEACHTAKADDVWQRVHTSLSDTTALLSSRLAPLLDLNGERADQQQRSFGQVAEFGTTAMDLAHSA